MVTSGYLAARSGSCAIPTGAVDGDEAMPLQLTVSTGQICKLFGWMAPQE
jgi:hypothetical protein